MARRYLIQVCSVLLFPVLLFSCSPADVDEASQSNTLPYAVASAHPLATRAGMDILKQGGNAFDAAVAVTAVLAVVEPYSSGIGGGGFWLLHRQSDDTQVVIDGREKAPLAATRDMYLDADGEVISNLSIDGPLSAGIPGVPAAIEHITTRYGKLSLAQNLKAAITIADNGFAVDAIYRRMAGFRHAALLASDDASEILLNDGDIPESGDIIVQKDLATTLRTIAAQGARGFYQGELADRLVRSVVANGGIWSREDLAGYEIVERQPVRFTFNDMQVVSVPPPSSGGVALAQIFNLLALKDYDRLDAAQRKHLIIESMRLAYRDRAEYLGDSDFVDVPVDKLISREYAEQLAKTLRMASATRSADLKPVVVDANKAKDTTHFSVIDSDGNRVSATLSVNYPFGSGFIAEGTGVLLNDEMDDFSSRPGTPNVYGLVGAGANAIEPGKRMLSSMSPTMAQRGERSVVLGTPGGSRIITMVLHGLLAFYDGADAEEIVDTPRYHHQYLPDTVFYEADALSESDKAVLSAKDHHLKKLDSTFGNMQVVVSERMRADGRVELSAAADKRGIGEALVSP